MHVASLELCKELYELSGWLDTEAQWGKSAYSGEWFVSTYSDRELRKAREFHDEPGAGDVYDLEAAYDLGYLLRKLPYITLENHGIRGTVRDTSYWRIDDVEGHGAEAKTPEDAAANLAIELFKQGILTNGKDSKGGE